MDPSQQIACLSPTDHLYMQSVHHADRNQSNNNCCKMLMKEKCGVELVQLLVACAQAIATGEVSAARQLVGRLSHLLSSRGSSMERVATYFTEALAECVGMKISDNNQNYSSPSPSPNPPGGFGDYPTAEESWVAYQVFYASCPYLIVTHFTANQAILEAFEGEGMVHVVDLDIKQGLQWPSLIQALSLRNGGPPQLRITGVAGAAPDFPSMMATRTRLLEFADMFNVPLEFTIITENMEDLQPWMMGVRDQEILAVNCVSSLHQLIDHPRRPLQSFLRMIHALEPSVVTVVEQDANHHQGFFPRFVGALHYYSSMFDSLAASLSSSLAEREIVERLLLGKEIFNIVGCEGDQRVERHQTVDQWMRYMTEAGFQLYPLSPHSILQAKFLLSMYPVSKFSIVNDEGYLSVGWQDNPLYAVSCWC
ncbi:hypothetical protein Mapa_017531 [Marchantia paleacea]|nr:hypothetical protein Mapa_017531 [Marchantia paleacea]